jgi:nucleotide-binding universal stress UspA family protein
MTRILVGYDGSDGGRRALDRAVAEARDSGAQITVLSVFDVPLDPTEPAAYGTPDDVPPWADAPLSAPPEVVAHLDEARDRLAAAGIEADLVWGAGEPASVIVEQAREVGADTIVIGEHHHGLLGRLFGEDVDGAVRKEAGCEVILA